MIHCRLLSPTCSDRPIEGSATLTMETSRTVMKKAAQTSASTSQRRRPVSVVSTGGFSRRSDIWLLTLDGVGMRARLRVRSRSPGYSSNWLNVQLAIARIEHGARMAERNAERIRDAERSKEAILVAAEDCFARLG